MEDRIYLLFSKTGVKSLFKRTKNVKSLPTGTYMAELNLEVDDSFFKNQIPVFNIKLESGNIVNPEIKPQVVERPKSFMELSFSLFDKLTGEKL